MSDRDALTREAYYLVLDFLRSGPCSAAADTLAAEAQRHGLLPPGATEADPRAAAVPRGFLADVLRYAAAAAAAPAHTAPGSLLAPAFAATVAHRALLAPRVPPALLPLCSRAPLRLLHPTLLCPPLCNAVHNTSTCPVTQPRGSGGASAVSAVPRHPPPCCIIVQFVFPPFFF